MTYRLPISIDKVLWRDGQKVNQADITNEQSYNVQSQSAIVNNFFGSGLIPNVPERTYLFHSDELTTEQNVYVASNKFDGNGIKPHAQPSDSTLGCQLEVVLKNSNIYGRRNVGILILGLDFEGSLQYETMTFHRNESQVTEKHFTKILGIIFNNFKGNSNGSRNYGGTITIQEAAPMQLSKKLITSSQNVEPNLFFRDLKLYSLSLGANITTALKTVITDVIGSSYSIDSLHIKTTSYKSRTLSANDITTRYAQKFLATSNNIQKIRLLLGTSYDATNKYNWSGNLVITLYALQTSITSSSDFVPSNAIDFLPDATPLAQITIDQTGLRNQGIILNNVEQPVDFVFSNTKIANALNSGIESGKYYMISIQRIGDASIGNIFTVTGNNTDSTNSKFAFFNGVAWTNVNAESMWYEVWSDNFKVADGMGVDCGMNMSVPKTIVSEDSGATINHSYNNISFVNSSQNQLNYAVVQAIKQQTTPAQDARTGNKLFSRENYKAVVSSVSTADLATLKTNSDPIILGCGIDMNNRTANTYVKSNYGFGMAQGNTFYVVKPEASLLAINLIGCKLTPNMLDINYEYRIVDTEVISAGLGDVNGDGQIDLSDLMRAMELSGQSLTNATTQTNIVNQLVVGSKVIDPLEIIRADIDQDGTVSTSDITAIGNYLNNKSSLAGNTITILKLTLENNIGRNDGYYDYSDNYIRQSPYSSNLISIANLTDDEIKYYSYPKQINLLNDITFTTVPFNSLSFSIKNDNDYWDGSIVLIQNSARYLPCSFTSYDMIRSVTSESLPNLFSSTSRYTAPEILGGHNDMYVPGNLIIGGQLLRNAKEYYNVDYEIANVIIELPENHEAGSIDIFNNFVIDSTGTGYTVLGNKAMRFADGSFVKSNALSLDQLRFSVAVQAYSPSLDGYTQIDGYGVIVDPVIGINLLNETGILQFQAMNLKCDLTNEMLRTKIQITVEMKKSGWLNKPLTFSYMKTANIVSDLP